MKLLVSISVLLLAVQSLNAQDCLSRDFNNGGTVCVCNTDHCDTFKPIEKVEESKFIKVTSNQAGLRFQKEVGEFRKQNLTAENVIEIGTEKYQEILGFGGSFTDSTGINIKSLSEDLGNKIISAYFSDDGLEYSVGRVPIGGTDFSLKGYSYCDTPNDKPDPDLENFKLQPEDFEYKISMISKALKIRNNKLNLFASAWIAPSWMKTIPGFNSRGSYIKDDMYQVWANYFVKFLDEYNHNNISFWGITTANEPVTAFLNTKIPSVAWNARGMGKWIKEHLGPTLRNSAHSNINLIINDDQITRVPDLTDMLLSNEKVSNYVNGIGTHWYLETIASTGVIFDTAHDLYPNKFIISTEACNGFLTNDVILGSWNRGELYAESIFRDLNHWVIGWVDWNMALNLQGGPTYIDNFVDAPIIVNATAGEFYKQPMYYVLGHFSKFIPKGSIRIKSTVIDEVVSIAVSRPDGATAVVILNKNDKDVTVTVRDERRGDISVNLTANSLTSIVYW
ncbi:unnamed protein product [Psylliodes chrysocephalus]|uniref:Glucosylceramidase n=1 Tax=Psylliodes chrysocephalus TaxID=3402493 RepID=A0A9P0CCY0_9CUCU|nr:unnamed protein product [Psylliodes chrysocephala]